MRTLSSVEFVVLTRLVIARVHPKKIDEYMRSRGFEDDEIEAVYEEHGLRVKSLLAKYRMKRNTRIIGIALCLFAGGGAGAVFFSPVAMIIAIALFAYGLVMAITGEIYLIRDRSDLLRPK